MTAEAIARKFAAALLLPLEVWSTSHALGWIDARIPETNHDQTQYEDTLSPWEWVYLSSCSAVLIAGLVATLTLSEIALGRQPWRFSGRATAVGVAYWAGVLCVIVATGSVVNLFGGLIVAPVYVFSSMAFVWYRSRRP